MSDAEPYRYPDLRTYGGGPIDRDVKDRRARVRDLAVPAFGDIESSVWLSAYRPEFGGRRGNDLVNESEEGLQQVLAEIARIAPSITPGKLTPPTQRHRRRR